MSTRADVVVVEDAHQMAMPMFRLLRTPSSKVERLAQDIPINNEISHGNFTTRINKPAPVNQINPLVNQNL